MNPGKKDYWIPHIFILMVLGNEQGAGSVLALWQVETGNAHLLRGTAKYNLGRYDKGLKAFNDETNYGRVESAARGMGYSCPGRTLSSSQQLTIDQTQGGQNHATQ